MSTPPIGMALFLSHSNEQTSLEALEKTKVPALVTHAGCAAVYDHPRNKSDRVLRAVVIGANFRRALERIRGG